MSDWVVWTSPLAWVEDGVELKFVGSAVMGIVTWVITTPLRSLS